MQIILPRAPTRYKGGTQIARVTTEPWAEENLYCPACSSPRLQPLKANTPAADFICPRCAERFQLKSGQSPFTTRIPDAAYARMVEAIRTDQTPSIFALHYDPNERRVRNLILIPRFAYSLKDIRERPPLPRYAQRHGWRGCDVLLAAIPLCARIGVIEEEIPVAPRRVRRFFKRLKPLSKISTRVRGWTLDVFRVVESLHKTEFELREVYAFEESLRALHPDNRFITAKIRQQLQILRNLGFVKFLGGGHYRLL